MQSPDLTHEAARRRWRVECSAHRCHLGVSMSTAAAVDRPASPGGNSRRSPLSVLIWTAVALIGAVCWTVLALFRGESVSALWILFAALSSYAIAYRFYARFIATRVLEVDDSRATPAERLENGVDFDVTDRRGLRSEESRGGEECRYRWGPYP